MLVVKTYGNGIIAIVDNEWRTIENIHEADETEDETEDEAEDETED